ncbi:MAG: lysophospholipid acyltransferase family protein [Syntrophorhabdales bacterium]
MIDFLLILVVRGFQGFLRVLPERLSCYTGVSFGRLGYLFLKDRRNVAIRNAMRISPGISREMAQRTARVCFEKLGVDLIEALLFQYLKKSDLADRFRLEMRGGVKETLAEDRGALALGFHYSNWEIMGVASHLLGREIVALARPLKGHAGLNRFLNGLRASTGLTIIPNKDTARAVMRLLKEKRMVAFLGDQREKRSKAVWVELFDHKVPTSKGIVAIAMKTGAPVIPIYSIREGFLRYTVVCDEPVLMERTGGDLEELIYRNARRINEVLERIVGGHPEEWFLVHRRFGRDT